MEMVPVEVSIKGFGAQVEVNSNTNPTMTMLALVMALEVMIKNHDIKPKNLVQPVELTPVIVPKVVS